MMIALVRRTALDARERAQIVPLFRVRIAYTALCAALRTQRDTGHRYRLAALSDGEIVSWWVGSTTLQSVSRKLHASASAEGMEAASGDSVRHSPGA